MARRAHTKAKRDEGPAVNLRLSRAQVDEVVRTAGPESNILGVLEDLGAELKLPVDDLDELPIMANRRLSRSVLTGILVLACFTSASRERRVRDVAAQLHMAVSTAHRSIKTLKAAGLLEQNPETRAYRMVGR